jgi:hypothetical protein
MPLDAQDAMFQLPQPGHLSTFDIPSLNHREPNPTILDSVPQSLPSGSIEATFPSESALVPLSPTLIMTPPVSKPLATQMHSTHEAAVARFVPGQSAAVPTAAAVSIPRVAADPRPSTSVNCSEDDLTMIEPGALYYMQQQSEFFNSQCFSIPRRRVK